jgi:hypothetical protein
MWGTAAAVYLVGKLKSLAGIVGEGICEPEKDGPRPSVNPS